MSEEEETKRTPCPSCGSDDTVFSQTWSGGKVDGKLTNTKYTKSLKCSSCGKITPLETQGDFEERIATLERKVKKMRKRVINEPQWKPIVTYFTWDDDTPVLQGMFIDQNSCLPPKLGFLAMCQWCDLEGDPLGFEPTHWYPIPGREEE